MALSFIILTLLIAGSIITGSYTMYLPFFISMQQSSQQTEAYYIARASMERWELAIKNHPLWFVGSGGYNNNKQRWPSGDNTPSQQVNIIKMWWISNNQDGANKENKLYPHKPIKIYLGYDDTSNPDHYYQNTTKYRSYKWRQISIDIQIPWELKNAIGSDNGLLCDLEDVICKRDKDQIYDNTMIDRYRQGQEGAWSFWIIPYTSTDKWTTLGTIDYSHDTNVREWTINSTQKPTLLFADTFNPLAQNNRADWLTWHHISWDVVSGIQNQTFTDILTNSEIQYNIIWLAMVSPGIRRDGKIYPYMHYKVHASEPLTSPMNTIQAYAQIQQNYIAIQSTKPSILTQQKWSFSISIHPNE